MDQINSQNFHCDENQNMTSLPKYTKNLNDLMTEDEAVALRRQYASYNFDVKTSHKVLPPKQLYRDDYKLLVKKANKRWAKKRCKPTASLIEEINRNDAHQDEGGASDIPADSEDYQKIMKEDNERCLEEVCKLTSSLIQHDDGAPDIPTGSDKEFNNSGTCDIEDNSPNLNNDDNGGDDEVVVSDLMEDDNDCCEFSFIDEDLDLDSGYFIDNNKCDSEEHGPMCSMMVNYDRPTNYNIDDVVSYEYEEDNRHLQFKHSQHRRRTLGTIRRKWSKIYQSPLSRGLQLLPPSNGKSFFHQSFVVRKLDQTAN